jgi:hypothetical protein
MAQVNPSRSHTRNTTLARLLVHLALFSTISSAMADGPLEYQVKAAFLLNFIKFVEWPESAFEDAASPMSICVLGEDPFGSGLDRIVKAEVVNGRSVTVRRLKRAPAPKSCQVLFLASPNRELETLAAPVLTVGEGERFLREGGIIRFVIENRRVRFDVNQTAAEKAGLKISSKLMTVARSVENHPHEK